MRKKRIACVVFEPELCCVTMSAGAVTRREERKSQQELALYHYFQLVLGLETIQAHNRNRNKPRSDKCHTRTMPTTVLYDVSSFTCSTVTYLCLSHLLLPLLYTLPVFTLLFLASPAFTVPSFRATDRLVSLTGHLMTIDLKTRILILLRQWTSVAWLVCN